MAGVYANLAVSAVATAPSPASSGTSLVVTTGEGARFPDPATVGPYPVTVWAAGALATPANAEIVTVTAKATNTLTITRAQEGTTARTVVVGDVVAMTITAAGLGSLTPDEYTTTTPGPPAMGADLFTRVRAGRRMIAQVGPSGLDYPFQPGLFANMVGFLRPVGNSATVPVANGIFPTATGVATAANWASTNLLTSLKRISYVSAATAGASGGVRSNTLQNWRGNAAGLGGFFFVTRFGFAAIPATRRWFCGMVGITGALASAEPSTSTNVIGVGQDTGDTTIQFMHNDAAGTCVKSTGSSALASPAVGEVLEVRVFCAPNGTIAGMSVEKLNQSGAVSEYNTPTTDLPANTQALAPQLWANNGTTAAVIDPHLVGMYVETDY